jgi:radical SAM superfamily enzyme YgiQ (UPF0313 family)
MKITFLIPPGLDGHRPPERVFGCTYGLYPIPNIFILGVGALLEKNGIKVQFIDSPVEGWRKKDLKKFLEKDGADIISFYTVNLSEKTDLLAAQMVRDIRGRDVYIAYFGPAPTHHPEAFLKDEKYIVIRGEPEYTFLSLAGALEKKTPLGSIKGISILEKGEAVNNPPGEAVEDLDSLPFPARHLLNKERYYNPKLQLRPFTAVLTSRGCSYRCKYCVPCSLSFSRELESRRYFNKKPKVALRSVENIKEEFDKLKEQGYRSAGILDDQFVWGEDRTIKICEAIAPSGIIWGCLSRADRITGPIAKAMRAAGCRYVDIGVESFSGEVLEDVKKDLEVSKVFNAVKLLKANGVGVKLNILLGASPRQTKDVIKRDITTAKGLRPDSIMFSLANPFPGTEFYNEAASTGWMKGGYKAIDVQKGVTISYPGISKRYLERMVRFANISFFFHPVFIWRNTRRLFNLSNLMFDVKILNRKIFRKGA